LLQHGGAFGPVLQAMHGGAWLFGVGTGGTVRAVAACVETAMTANRTKQVAAIVRRVFVCIISFTSLLTHKGYYLITPL